MKQIDVYLILRVMGAIDSRADNSIKSRIREVSKRTFHEAEGKPRVFTWRTIPTWLPIYRQRGVQALVTRLRKSKPEASDATVQD